MVDQRLADSERPTSVRWSVFAIACGTSWLLYFHRYTFALIKPELQEEWGLGKDELGLLDSAFYTSYSLFQIPLGIAGDALGVRLMLTLLVLVWSSALGLQAFAPSMKVLAASRALLGLGQSAVYACLSRVTRNWFPAQLRTSLQGWIGVFFGRVGGLSANLIFGALLMGTLGVDWRTLLYACAGVGAAHAGLVWYMLRDRPGEHPSVNPAETALIEGEAANGTAAPSSRLTMRQLFRMTSGRSLANLLALNVQTILSTAADTLYSDWIPLFLKDVYLFDSQQRGLMSALPLLGGAIGGTLGGWLNDRLIRATGDLRRGRRIVGVGGKGIASVLLLGALLAYDQPVVFCTLLFFVKFFSDSGLATTWGTVTDIGGKATASVFAFNNAVAGIGSIIAPAVFGAMAAEFGWKPVFVTAAGCYLLCGLSWLLIDPRIPIVQETATVPDTRRDGID